MNAQLINADFEQRVVLQPPAPEDWVPSPMAGVLRRPLDRVGGEVARATSLVRYAPGSQFKRHEHGGGEEILVLDGVSTALVRWAPHTQFNPHSHPGGEEIFVLEGLFRDESGAYPVGSWLRSPRWSRHTPYTGAEGAIIYVKVGHFSAEFMTLPAA